MKKVTYSNWKKVGSSGFKNETTWKHYSLPCLNLNVQYSWASIGGGHVPDTLNIYIGNI